jgi:hypothetical protein
LYDDAGWELAHLHGDSYGNALGSLFVVVTPIPLVVETNTPAAVSEANHKGLERHGL